MMTRARAKAAAPDSGLFDGWKALLRDKLRRTSFRYFPDIVPAAEKLGDADALSERLQSEAGIEFRLRYTGEKVPDPKSVLLVMLGSDEAETTPEWIKAVRADGQAVALC